ncbi:hypothetical protein C8F04DRAFT_1242050 [Mycena alexandri]|uniref:Cyanovirin-N domain-containing protein n=1 Tax=Mycena alexandri TaxID=1745969 RepID=A0AAD6S4W5_9AGAR|nr:hypothetical protein C8F04DRAFT_1242050 [Mycena alexandri]
MQFNILSAFIVASVTFSHVQAAAVNGTTAIAAPAHGATAASAPAPVNGTTAAAPAATGAVKGDSVEPVPLTGGAGNSCDLWMIIDNTNVAAFCTDSNGVGVQDLEVSLGACITNNNGHLSCQVGGGADQSCTFFDIVQSNNNVFIDAQCNTNDGGFIDTLDFNLNNCFSNNNGRLTC